MQLDLDSVDALTNFRIRQEELEGLGLIPVADDEQVLKSKSGNWHVILKLDKPLPVERRILLQALLGSDLTREALALARVEHGIPNPPLSLPAPPD